MLAPAGPAFGPIDTHEGHQARSEKRGSRSFQIILYLGAKKNCAPDFRLVGTFGVVPERPKRTTDETTTTTTRKKYSASHTTSRVGPPAQRVGGGHGGAVVLLVVRHVLFVSCVAPRGAGTNLNDSDAAAWWFVCRYL